MTDVHLKLHDFLEIIKIAMTTCISSVKDVSLLHAPSRLIEKMSLCQSDNFKEQDESAGYKSGQIEDEIIFIGIRCGLFQ